MVHDEVGRLRRLVSTLVAQHRRSCRAEWCGTCAEAAELLGIGEPARPLARVSTSWAELTVRNATYCGEPVGLRKWCANPRPCPTHRFLRLGAR